jgi:hypothetical protein
MHCVHVGLALLSDLVATPDAQHALHSVAVRLATWPGAVQQNDVQRAWPALPLASWARPHVNTSAGFHCPGGVVVAAAADLGLDQCLDFIQQLSGSIYSAGKTHLSQQLRAAHQDGSQAMQE